MSFDYAKTAATATRLLQRFGQSATLKRETGTRYDPATGAMVAVAAECPCIAAVLDYTARDIDGTLIQQGDKRVLIGPYINLTPQAGDVIELSTGASVTVIAVTTTAPAGRAVLFDAQCRG